VRDSIVERYGIEPMRHAGISLEEQARLHGDELWSRDPGVCCDIRKVQPLTHALKPLQAWITGIRRDQSPTRANAGIVQEDQKFGLVKVNPLARWTWDEVWEYIRENKVPYNVLHDKGYPSIGCAPCTQSVQGDSTDRSGRWSGSSKTECGLHE
jgi:phosphoadenosine phosphosulfate reductase